jgi:hypothetical protein
MKRYLIYPVNHTVLLVDATPIGLPNEIYPPEGKKQLLTSLRFQSWAPAEQFLLSSGATAEMLHGMRNALRTADAAVLTITN